MLVYYVENEKEKISLARNYNLLRLLTKIWKIKYIVLYIYDNLCNIIQNWLNLYSSVKTEFIFIYVSGLHYNNNIY